jgi:hypothetical protein
LARRLADYARTEPETPLARALDAITEAAEHASIDTITIPEAKNELRDAYTALYAPKEEGLANFLRWHPDLDTRRMLNRELAETRSRLDQLLIDGA